MDPRAHYREAAVRGAGPVLLVVLLYEQIIEDLRQAVNAIEQRNIELRTRKINHAILVIGNLQSSLNKPAGQQVALNLERFYEQLRGNLVRAQFHASREILSQQIIDLIALREAWVEVDRADAATRNPKPISFTVDGASSMGPGRADWNG
jgi:flagellar secretion chaperone FliS